MSACLSTERISKSFLGNRVLDAIDFELRAGEIHALMGENGAGKSTLIKILTGVYQADSGAILRDGKPVVIGSPADAVAHGISTVYQEVNVLPNLTVGENICIRREPRGPFGIRWKQLNERAATALDRVGLNLDPQTPIRSCSIAVQQMVAIARALDISAKILVLDEPTSSLDEKEVRRLFDLMERLKEEGLGIIFVTHFLDQVYETSGRITVLRNGVRAGTWTTQELGREALINQMLGREGQSLASEAKPVTPKAGRTVVSTHGLGRKGSVNNISLEITKGEVVGLAGLLGSGRTESAHLIYGIDAATTGSLTLDGKPVDRPTPKSQMRRGIGYCSEDRKAEGILPELSVRENIILALQAKRGWLRRIDTATQTKIGEQYIKSLNIRPPDLDRPISLLSGGNQQKVLLARWLAADPELLILDEPTRGIDIGAKVEILQMIKRLQAEGMAFLFISSELAETVSVANRVLVLRDRSVVAELTGEQISEAEIVRSIAGSE